MQYRTLTIDFLFAIVIAFICTKVTRSQTDLTQLQAVHDELIRWHGNMPGQYRLLSFFFPDLLMKTGFSLIESYMLIVWATLSGAFFLFIAAIKNFLSANVLRPYFSVSLLALTYIMGVSSVIQPADSWVMLGVALLLFSISIKSKTRAIALMVATFSIAAVTKENAFFYSAGVIARLWDSGEKKKSILQIIAVLLPGLSIWIVIHFIVPANGSLRYELLSNLAITMSVLRDLPHLLVKGDVFNSSARSAALYWLIIFPVILWILVRGNKSQIPRYLRWAGTGIPVALWADLTFGVMSEFRICVDLFIMLIPIALVALSYPAPGYKKLSIKNTVLISLFLVGYILSLFIASKTLKPNGFYAIESDKNGNYRWFDRHVEFTTNYPGSTMAAYLPLRIPGAPADTNSSILLKIKMQQQNSTHGFNVALVPGNEWSYIPLPFEKGFREGEIKVSLDSEFYFIPAALPGYSSDRRILTAQVANIDYRNLERKK